MDTYFVYVEFNTLYQTIITMEKMKRV